MYNYTLRFHPQFGQPCVRMQRVKEFRFREILKPARHSADQDDLVNSVENLVQVPTCTFPCMYTHGKGRHACKCVGKCFDGISP